MPDSSLSLAIWHSIFKNRSQKVFFQKKMKKKQICESDLIHIQKNKIG